MRPGCPQRFATSMIGHPLPKRRVRPGEPPPTARIRAAQVQKMARNRQRIAELRRAADGIGHATILTSHSIGVRHVYPE